MPAAAARPAQARKLLAASAAIALTLLAAGRPAAAQENPAAVNALWVAESSGAIKVATAEGSLLLEIPGLVNVRAVAVDHHRSTLWLYAGQNLYAYGYDGTQELVVPRALPNPAHAALAVNEQDGSIWLGADQSLVSVSASGQVLASLRLVDNVRALAVDGAGALLWVGTKNSVAAYDAISGTLVSSLDLGNNPDLRDLDLDPTGKVWVVLADAVRRYAEDGTPLLAVPLTAALHVAGDSHGGAWVTTTKDLLQVNPAGQVTLSLSPFGARETIVEVVLDPSNDNAWLADDRAVAHVDATGQLVRAFQFQPPVHIWDLALYADVIPPQLAITAPADGSYINSKTPAIKVTYSDIGSGVNPSTLAFTANGASLPVSCTTTGTGASCTVTTALAEGTVTLAGTVRDYAGNTSQAATVTFTVDTIPPVITLTQPTAGLITNQPAQTFVGAVSEASSLSLNGGAVGVHADLTFSQPVQLVEGVNTFTLVATDRAGNVSQLAISLTLDTIPPAPISASKVVVSAPSGGQVTLTAGPGSAEPAATASITNARTGQVISVTIAADGSLVATVTGQAGDVLQIVLTDAAGNHSAATSVSVPGNSGGGGLPPDPATVAPPIDPTVPTDIAASTAFLYSGPNAIQAGVVPGTIDARRAAVLRGQVLDGNASPLPGVTITIVGHPEFGSTLSRLDGVFDLVVNGGGMVLVQYDKSGYARAQRRVVAPWRDFAWIEKVVLVPYDHRVTLISSGSASLQVARGSAVSDQDGTRTATLLFPPGTQASMTLADGSTKLLPTLSVRATEFTVDGSGPAAMPAPLPPTSAYTYAVELSSDEAISAGAQSVVFSQPVIQYVENFLAFPVGSEVPAGYYDRALGAWVASANGLVIKILGATNGLADLDLTGTGAAASASDLAALGISDAERQELATLYQPGQSLWRVPVTHFTPWDYNWPFAPPLDATSPDQPPAEPADQPEDEPDCQQGSIIACQNQTLGEALPLAGTPFTLHYVSDRAPAYLARRRITIPLSGSSVPASLRRIELQVAVAGQVFTQTFPAAPNQSYVYTVSGLDAYGRLLQGGAKVEVVIGYVYGAVYLTPQTTGPAFALYSSFSSVSAVRMRNEYIVSQQYQTYLGALGTWDARGVGLGGWTLNVHHVYDADSGALYRGDGRTARTSGTTYGRIVSTSVTMPPSEFTFCLTRDGEGNLYVCSYNHIVKVAPDGTVTTVAGQMVGGYAGDGGPATAAMLYGPKAVAVDRSGNLFIADTYNDRIRKVDAQGIITTIAGNQESLSNPWGVAVDGEGNVFFADTGVGIIRRIGLDGTITAVAGNGGYYDYPPDGRATSLALRGPRALAIDDSGNLLLGDTENSRVFRINADGTASLLAGIPVPIALTMDRQGNLMVIANQSLGGAVFKVTPDRAKVLIAGSTTSFGSPADNIPATSAMLGNLSGIAIDGDGSILLAEQTTDRIRRVGNLFPGFSDGAFIPSPTGEEMYFFDREGRHVRTANAVTGATLLTFGYDLSGRLAAVTDGDGNTTSIERDSSGQMTAIVAPFGQRTPVSVSSDGYVASVTDPAGEAVHLSYQAGGLLTAMTDARGNSSHFSYDPVGRLVLDADAASGFKQLTRTQRPTGYSVALATALGRTSSYSIDVDAAGDKTRSNVLPSGLVSTTRMNTDGSESTGSPDGTTVSLQLGPDPRFGMLAPVVAARRITTPGGLVYSSSHTRTLTAPNNVPVLTDVLTVNGNTFTKTFDAAQSLYSLTTPAGRHLSTLIDPQGRPVRTVAGSLAPTQFIYDGQGRLTSLTAGSGPDARSLTLSYDALGRVATVTNPLQQTVGFSYDKADRPTQETLPDGQALAISFDANGNELTFTPPGQPAHAFAYNAVDLLASYSPPALASGRISTTYAYDADHALISVTRPDGGVVTAVYEGGGRLAAITDDRGSRTISYDPATGNVSSITGTDGGQLSYLYDGSLLRRTTWSGVVAGTIDSTYDANFSLASVSVNGGNATSFQYDADGLLTQAGNLALSYDAQNALLTGTNLGAVSTSTTFNAFGEPIVASTSANGTPLWGAQYARDRLGRISVKTETIAGAPDTYAYSYDPSGRLTDVQLNGQPLAHYSFDANGNRTSTVQGTTTTLAAYDAQDRLLQRGDTTYAYTANGDLASKSQNGSTVTFAYDSLGNLVTVTDASGIRTDYIMDGQNRRVGKKINGVLVQGFLWQDQLKIAAELDGGGNVMTSFVYATHDNVPDYMVKNGAYYNIVTDQLASPRLVVNATTGEIAQRLDYDAWGSVVLDTNPGFQPFGFAGGLYDSRTGLVRFGARDYDPQTGRWTTKDPTLFGGISTNLYTYGFDDPVNMVDRDGQIAVPIVGVGAVVVVAAVVIVATAAYEVWVNSPEGKQWLRDHFTLPIFSLRPWYRPSAPGRSCPVPKAIPGARPRVTPPPPLVNAKPGEGVPPPIEPEDPWWKRLLKNISNLPLPGA